MHKHGGASARKHGQFMGLAFLYLLSVPPLVLLQLHQFYVVEFQDKPPRKFQTLLLPLPWECVQAERRFVRNVAASKRQDDVRGPRIIADYRDCHVQAEVAGVRWEYKKYLIKYFPMISLGA